MRRAYLVGKMLVFGVERNTIRSFVFDSSQVRCQILDQIFDAFFWYGKLQNQNGKNQNGKHLEMKKRPQPDGS